MDLAIAIDFGSTFTKGVLFDLTRTSLLASAYEPSTVDTDVRVGLRKVLARLSGTAGRSLAGVPAYVCSSAAGGLRMIVIGLVPSLSLEAAQRAALGAGAKIIGAYGHKLPPATLKAIEAARPDLVLLAGGIDGGDEETILHNARALAASALTAPVIVAGNASVASDCSRLLEDAGKTAFLAPNILPEIDRIEIDTVHTIIRELFVGHITRAKGIERVAGEVALDSEICPTPSAVLQACRLLSQGVDGRTGWGDIVVADIGGATTDIHSAASGAPTRPGAIPRGLPELFLKRTVEGDLGMRANAATIVERAGQAAVLSLASGLAGRSLPAAALSDYVNRVGAAPDYVPRDETEAVLDAAMARAAIKLAMQRHAGRVREVYTGAGPALVQHGKDLTNVATVIGVGGVLARGRYGEFALSGVLRSLEESEILCPAGPRFLIDRAYVLFAIGLLAEVAPQPAFDLAQALLEPAA